MDATSATIRRTAFIASLRACADFLDAHPTVRTPSYAMLDVFVYSREEIAQHARAGTWEKVFNGDWFYLVRRFGDDLELHVTTERATVCRKVVTGTKILPAQPEQEVEEVSWVCDEATLLGDRP